MMSLSRYRHATIREGRRGLGRGQVGGQWRHEIITWHLSAHQGFAAITEDVSPYAIKDSDNKLSKAAYWTKIEECVPAKWLIVFTTLWEINKIWFYTKACITYRTMQSSHPVQWIGGAGTAGRLYSLLAVCWRTAGQEAVCPGHRVRRDQYKVCEGWTRCVPGSLYISSS